MSEETTEPKPRRGRPPGKETRPGTEYVGPSPADGRIIPAPPAADPKSIEMKDWIFTYLPNEMARNFYGGINHIPRP